ncbi:MAG TPA: CapA family protein [Chitinophaga sp.]|nr:CapA family protein [Chitinophaga sp.]
MLRVARSIPLFSFNVIGLIIIAHVLFEKQPVRAEYPHNYLHHEYQLEQLKPADVTDTISISVVGDLMIGSSYPAAAFLPVNEDGNILQYAMPLLKQTDLRLGNLEGTISDNAKVFKNCGTSTQCFAFRTPVKYAQWYKEAGFDYLNLANNHSFDFGMKGVEHTLAFLDSNNIRTSGVPQHPIDTLTIRNTKFGFVSFAPHSNCLDLNNDTLVASYVKEVRKQCDVLVVFFHGGAEGASRKHTPKTREFFMGQNRGHLTRFSRICVDAGADLVLGSGPHVVRGMEMYKGKLIVYSLGNFATYHQFNLKSPNNVAPLLQVKITNEGNLVENKVFSFLQEGEGVPKPDSTMQAFRMIRSLSEADFGFTGVDAGSFD